MNNVFDEKDEDFLKEIWKTEKWFFSVLLAAILIHLVIVYLKGFEGFTVIINGLTAIEYTAFFGDVFYVLGELSIAIYKMGIQRFLDFKEINIDFKEKNELLEQKKKKNK